MKKLVILGASGLGRETLWVAREINKRKKQWNILGFVDENKELHNKKICDIPVLGGFSWIEENNEDGLYVVCGIGNTHVRKKIAYLGKDIDLKFATLIHPSVLMSQYNIVGEGVVITACNIITCDVSIGNHVFLNLNCTIGHDCILEDYVNCAPGCNISGNVKLKKGAHLGTNSTIIQDITIGEWTTIGAGATVIDDIPDNVVAVGTPAKVIRKK